MNKHTLVIAVAVAIATIGVAPAAPMKNGPGQGQPTSNSAQLSPTQRGEIVAQIVSKWGPYVQQVHKTSVGAWAQRMHATFVAATDSNLQRAAGMKTFQGMMDALVGQHLTDSQVMDSLVTQARVLKSGPVTALLGSTTADLVYTPLAPCRIVDTRNVGGPIAGTTFVSFHGANPGGNFAFQGGTAGSDCGIPASPSALMINVAAPIPTQSGYLTVWPFGTAMPLASNLDYHAGDLANNEIAAKMSIGLAADFSVYAHGTTNVVIDVVGYFMAPQATALDTTQASRSDAVAAGAVGEFTIACPVGYALTGGGCYTDNDGVLQINGNTNFFGTQFCAFRNVGAVSSLSRTYATCSRVPGR